MLALRVALGLFTLLVFAAPALAQQDQLTGTWRFRSFAGINARGGICASGSVTFDPLGAVVAAGSSLQECDTAVPPMPLVGGTMIVGPNGALSGTVAGFDLEGNFLPTGDAFVAVSTVNNEGSPIGFGLGVFVRADTATTFAASDLAGTWRVHLVQGGELPTEISESAFGSIVVEPDGAITSGTLTFFSAEFGASSSAVVGGRVTVDPDGMISGTIQSREGMATPVSTDFSGLMAPDKKLAAGALRTVDGETIESGLTILQRETPSTFAIADLAGTWTFHNVVLDPVTADQSTWLRGTLTVSPLGLVTSGTLAAPFIGSAPVIGSFAIDPLGVVGGELALGETTFFSILGTMFDTKDHIVGVDMLFGSTGEGLGGPAGVGLLSMVKSGPTAPPAVVQLSAPIYTVGEAGGSVVVTITRVGTNLTDTVSVAYATGDGSAVSELDYTPTSGTVTFDPGETSRTVTIPIIDDTLAEANETFTFTLSDPSGGATLGSPASAIITIKSDEQSAIQFSAGNYAAKEGKPAVITILRSGALATPATVTFTATPGSAVPGVDFTPVTRLVSFAKGETSKAVTVPTLNDKLVQGTRTVLLGLSGPAGGAGIGARSAAVLSIAEDDRGGTIALSAPSYTVSEGAGSVLVTILRTGTNLAGNVSVSYATGNGSALSGSDYVATVDTVTFDAGETTKRVRIPILQDALVEPNETFTFTLGAPTGGARPGEPSSATITIKDDDVPSRIKLGASSYRVVEGAGNASIMVVRSAALFREVTVHYSTSPAGTNPATPDASEAPDADYGAVEGDITFQPNQTTAFITVPIFQDSAAEGHETFLLTLSEPGPGASVASPSSATVTILDDESVVQFSLKFMGNMPEVVRTGPTNTPVTVDFFSEDGTATAGVDYAPMSGTLTFKVGQSSAFIPLVIKPDIFAEGPETFTISLANPLPEGSARLGAPSSQTWAITDNDFGGTVQFGVANLTASPGESKKIPIVRTGGGGTILTVNWRAISGTTSEAFSPTSGSVTFGANETTKSFTVNVEEFERTGADLTAVFALSVAPGAANVGAKNTSTLTIFGSPATVDLPFSVYSVVEGGGPAVVSVTRGGTLDRQVSVAYATADDTALAGRHYTATSGRLTFAPGQQVAAFTIPILGSGSSGQTRSLNLTLTKPSPGTVIGEGSRARLQIRKARVFTYRLIADNTDSIVGFGGVPSLNDAGTVAFKAFMADEDTRVFKGSGGALTTIASAATREFLGIDGSRFPIDGAGNVVFLATDGNERQTIFRGSGGGLTPLMQADQTYTRLFDPSVSPNGNVAFGGQAEGGVAIFTGAGAEGVSLFVAAGDEVFDQVGGLPAVNDDGTVAFVGVRNGGPRSVFLANPNDGGLAVLATDVTTDSFASISLNGSEQVAFITGLPAPDGEGILIGRNGSAVTTFVTRANGFQLFGQPEEDSSPAINALGAVAYLGLTLDTFGILTGPDPDADMVIRQGDPLFGSNVSFLRFGGFNAAGQIAFRADLVDGREVIVVGSPPARR